MAKAKRNRGPYVIIDEEPLRGAGFYLYEAPEAVIRLAGMDPEKIQRYGGNELSVVEMRKKRRGRSYTGFKIDGVSEDAIKALRKNPEFAPFLA